ncbi:hypothetical protein VNO77_25451 [Canavalia gladiata]|uniref:Uncharacterized protein n=1 Tax=Canavalia gladiata TaxID=3824 RepID=A0AAN9QDJ5_CANGL
MLFLLCSLLGYLWSKVSGYYIKVKNLFIIILFKEKKKGTKRKIWMRIHFGCGLEQYSDSDETLIMF